VRIIKHGVDPEAAKQHRVKCRNCGTVFEFAQDEAQTIPDQRDGDFMQITCPVCKRMVTKYIDRRCYYP